MKDRERERKHFFAPHTLNPHVKLPVSDADNHRHDNMSDSIANKILNKLVSGAHDIPCLHLTQALSSIRSTTLGRC